MRCNLRVFENLERLITCKSRECEKG